MNIKNVFFVLLLIVLSAVILTPAMPVTTQVPTHDSGIFLYFGQQILRGQVPFRDLWDHKPPLVFYIDALGLYLGRGSRWGVWVLEFLSLSLTMILSYWLLQKKISKLAAWLACLLGLLNLNLLLERGNLTEEFVLPFQLISLCVIELLESGVWKKMRWLGFVVVGACMGTAAMLKQPLIGIWLAYGLIVLWRGLNRKKVWEASRSLLWMGLGFLLPWGVCLGYFASQQALTDLWEIAFVYNFVYSDLTMADKLQAVWQGIIFLLGASVLFAASLAVWMLEAGGLFNETFKPMPASRRKINQLDWLLLVILIDIPIELILIATSGKNYPHYFLSILVVMTLMGGFILERLLIWTLHMPDSTRAIVLGLAVLFFGLQGLMGLQELFKPVSDLQTVQTLDYIYGHTQKGETVLMWGSQTTVNYLANRASPTRFVHQKALFKEGFARPEFALELLKDLQQNKPALIIDTKLGATPFITYEGQKCVLPPAAKTQALQSLFGYICDNYQVANEIGKDQWLVMARKP